MNFSIQPNATLAAIMANGTKAEFNIDTCLNTVKALQVAYPEANLTLKLNLAECYQYCGKGFGHYEFWGVVDALTTWVFPLLNLLGNVCFTPTSLLGTGWKGGWGYSNFVAVDTHLLANPLDAIYNLASKLDVGRRIRKCCDGIDLDGLDLDDQEKVKVRRDIANVCYALDDFGPDRLCDRATKLINSLRYTDVRRRPAAFRSLRAIRAASYEIALARENNALHSALAIILYGVLVFAALLKTRAEGGVAYHQPHTIALRELYYWLLLSIILSSAAGRWSTQWAPYKSLRQLGYEIDASKGFELVEIEPWNGGNYVWRPYNNIFRSDDSRTRRSLLNPFAWALWNQHTFSIGPDQQTSDHRHLLHLFIAFLSLGASWALSFMISWRTPTVGIGGRGLCEMAFLVVWLASFMLTQWLGTRAKGRALFLLVWAIDTFISICAFLVLFVAFQGWYNSCISWSAYFSRGSAGAYIDLEMKNTEIYLTFRYYFPAIVGAILVQFALAGLILWLNWSAVALGQRSDQEHRTAVAEDTGTEMGSLSSGSDVPLSITSTDQQTGQQPLKTSVGTQTSVGIH